MPLAGFTARAAGGRIVAGLREKTGNAGAVDRFHERTAERYAQLLGHSKGVLMKAGQIFSMVDPGAVGNGELSPYQKALTRLQADAPPMDAQLARDVVQADLRRRVEDRFAEFSDEPMAAASIGQVHRAVLHDGRQVAVKIQYPGVAEAIRDDLANTELLTTFYRFATATSGTTIPDLRECDARDRRAHLRGTRLPPRSRQHRGLQPAVPRSSLHPHPRGHRRGVRRPGADHDLSRRNGLGRSPTGRPRPQGHLVGGDLAIRRRLVSARQPLPRRSPPRQLPLRP